MKNNRSNHIATVAMFFAAMLVIHLLTSVLFNVLPFPIKPTIVHIPVIIASHHLRATNRSYTRRFHGNY